MDKSEIKSLSAFLREHIEQIYGGESFDSLISEWQASQKKQCPDYKPEECRTKLGVITCAQVEHKNKYKCPIIDYTRERIE